MSQSIQFKKLCPDAIIPTRATKYSAGWDLSASADTMITPFTKGPTIIPTGIAVQLPPGTYGRIALRSGVSMHYGLTVTAGVIDRDYTDEIKVMVLPQICFTKDGECIHSTSVPFMMNKGVRFAQLIVEHIYQGEAEVVTEFSHKFEPHLGFGSTDKK